MNELIGVSDSCFSSVASNSNTSEGLSLKGFFTMECLDAEGNLKWKEEFNNLVTTVGKYYLLDALQTASVPGSTYMGLITSGTPVIGDTMSSKAFTEFTGIANRASITWAAASGTAPASKATNPAATSFSITSGGTVTGCFIVLSTGSTNSTSGTTGTLYSAGTFTSKTVATSDTLNVSYSTTLS